MTDNTVDWNTYCGYPFNHLAMKEYQGDQLYQAWPCCNVGRYGRDHVSIQGVNNLTPDQIFEHPRLEQLRHNLLSGIKDPICTVCWRMEDQLQTRSYRQYSPGYEQKIPVPKKLTSVNLRTSGMCNLRCRMCYTNDSHSLMIDHRYFEEHGLLPEVNQSMGTWGLPKAVNNSSVDNPQWDWLMEHTAEINHIRASGGEPFYDGKLIKLLKRYAERGHAAGTTLWFSTNATMFTDEMLDVISPFINDHSFSIDGSGKIYEYVRFPQDWTELQHSINRYIDRIAPPRIRINMVVSALNLLNIDQFIAWGLALYDNVNVSLHEIFPTDRGTSLYRLPVHILEQAKQRLLHSDSISRAKGTVLSQIKNIDHAITHNREDRMRMLSEISVFDRSRGQDYRDFLDPLLVSWLDSNG